jgi:hypothetical protein
MISLFMPLVLCFTVVASVGLGVLAAYAAFMGILHAVGRKSQPEASRPRLALVPTQNHAGGD